jgi:ATPase subunit of ABC transporter with duplicated ATPase domains
VFTNVAAGVLLPFQSRWKGNCRKFIALPSLVQKLKRKKEPRVKETKVITIRYAECCHSPSIIQYASKAFAPRSGRRADRQGRRNVDRDQARLHVPLVNRTPDDRPPPVIVAIVGPPGVGKTTLLKSLVRRHTKQNLNEAKGPITVVSGKNQRLTFVECNNDLNSMIDIGKIADLVVLMIDGSFGFEMVCRSHLC